MKSLMVAFALSLSLVTAAQAATYVDVYSNGVGYVGSFTHIEIGEGWYRGWSASDNIHDQRGLDVLAVPATPFTSPNAFMLYVQNNQPYTWLQNDVWHSIVGWGTENGMGAMMTANGLATDQLEGSYICHEMITGLTGREIIRYSFEFDVTETNYPGSRIWGSVRFNSDANGIDPVATPEPGTFALIGMGITGFALLQRRKQTR
jgi:hypothetical protein